MNSKIPILAFNAIALFEGSDGVKRFATAAADALSEGPFANRLQILVPSCRREQLPDRFRRWAKYFWAPDLPRGAAFLNHFWSNLLSIHLRVNAPGALLYSPLESYAVIPFPRCAMTAHDCYADRFGDPRKQGRVGLGRRLSVRQLKKSQIFSVSAFTTRELDELHQIRGAQVETVLNWLDRDFDYNPTLQHQNRVRIELKLPDRFWLYVGGFRINKNLPLLFEAYAATMNKFSDCSPLVIAGRIPETDTVFNGPFHSAIDRHPGLRERIVFPGFIPGEDLASLYKLSSLVICPSSYEGFGFPVIEALAVGAPVIAARAASLVELGLPETNHFCPVNSAELVALLTQVHLHGSERFQVPLPEEFLPANGESRFRNAMQRWIGSRS